MTYLTLNHLPVKHCKRHESPKRWRVTKSGGYDCRCDSCEDENNLRKAERRAEEKLKWVNVAGGKCCLCGYHRFIGVLEFHHINPEDKLFEISEITTTMSEEIILEEIDKCILLCSNCHAEAHILDTPNYRIFLDETKKRVARENQ